MDRVSAEFYKNVILLTKFVPPNDDFDKLFKEGMFDKPNTLGFIHVSFYLLNIYYKDNIKNKVQWPVICKQTENKFRNDVRECLMAIANENPDINFPPIFASHLLLARGTKFLLIMWKFSLVVLRTFLTKEYHSVMSISPKPGPCQELTKTFLKNVTKDNNNVISNIRNERENIIQEAKEFEKKKNDKQSELKLKILKMKENLKEITITAPVNDTARTKLINTDDNEIVNMWASFIDNNLKTALQNDYEFLKEMNEVLKCLGNIVLNIIGNLPTLNALNFSRIDVDPIYKLVPPELQVLPYGLYNKESLNLQHLFSIFNILIKKYKVKVTKYQCEELSECNKQLEISNKDLKIAINHFQKLHEQIANFNFIEMKNNNELNDYQKVISNVPEFDKVLFMPSPSIQLNNHYEGRRSFYQNNLKLTPIEGAHKQLFSRHAFNEKNMCSMKKPLSVQCINFDDSLLFDASGDKQLLSQQRFHTPSKLKCTFKNVDKYSRIFSSCKLNNNKDNKNVMSMMSSTSNSMLPLMAKQHCISLMDSYNSSQEFSREPFLLNSNLHSSMDPSNSDDAEKVSQKNTKRRSIGDLVERYKKLLQKRDTQEERNASTKELLDEEIVI
ncbi:PREDICTED: uncharacterized protein LOC105359369 [Ceratosolen solmsi marchali]|uniref:Uncharacterized protein LOC105359369 n=1 Tax=Ceratosolen solmsi marchali TaxID=326594 RepID=A0AAJ6VL03_9HYME|nr:PREDICTED: uncharacterized protein LOC105359369 [Ceratosolen solmsi marchali]